MYQCATLPAWATHTQYIAGRQSLSGHSKYSSILNPKVKYYKDIWFSPHLHNIHSFISARMLVNSYRSNVNVVLLGDYLFTNWPQRKEVWKWASWDTLSSIAQIFAADPANMADVWAGKVTPVTWWELLAPITASQADWVLVPELEF